MYTQGCPSSLHLLYPLEEVSAALRVLCLGTGIGLHGAADIWIAGQVTALCWQCQKGWNRRTPTVLPNPSPNQWVRGKKRTPHSSSIHSLTLASGHLLPLAASTPSPAPVRTAFELPFISMSLLVPWISASFCFWSFPGLNLKEWGVCANLPSLQEPAINFQSFSLLFCCSFHLILGHIYPCWCIMVNLHMFFRLFILLLYHFLLDFLYSGNGVLTPWF